MPRIKESNLKHGDFPELKGNAVKAANTKACVPWVMNVQDRATTMDPSDKNKSMLKVVVSLNEIYKILYGAGYFLTREELEELSYHLARLGRHYQFLAVHAFRDEQKTRWQIISKFHFCFRSHPFMYTDESHHLL